MLKSKIISITSIILALVCFAVFETQQESKKYVLKILTPTKIEIDLNNNGITDLGETICISEIETLTATLSQDQSSLTKSLGISKIDGIKLGYLTDNFASNILNGKKVKLKFLKQKNQNCKYADIYVNNESYREKLKHEGLAFSNKKPILEKTYKNKLSKAQKLELVIFNHRSNKYHKIDCKYGLIANDKVLIPKEYVPKEAVPCKYCHNITSKNNHHDIQNITSKKTYPLSTYSGSIKLILTDSTIQLKPNNKCTSLACKEILTQINNSKESIDIALYGWSSTPEINQALLNAKKRGVKIRVVYDTSQKGYYPDTLSIVNISDKSSTDSKNLLMHNKFMIFDKNRVITGSMNFSNTGFSGFNTNSIIFVNSKEIAEIFEQEFNQMLSGKFHQDKTKIPQKTVYLGSTEITPSFSPKGKTITSNIIPLINGAKSYIYIPAFVITHDEMANALIKKKKNGIDIKIIIDATNVYASRSKIKLLRDAGIKIKVENYAGKMHSKTLIIDDKYLIMGSMNFSNSGENKNDENMLIIKDARLAKYYRGFFEYFWNKIPDKYLKQGIRAEGKHSVGSCSDGIDNNFDGKIDMDDPGCK